MEITTHVCVRSYEIQHYQKFAHQPSSSLSLALSPCSRCPSLLAFAPAFSVSHFSLYFPSVSRSLTFSSSRFRALASAFLRISSSSSIRVDVPSLPDLVFVSCSVSLLAALRECSGVARGDLGIERIDCASAAVEVCEDISKT